MERNWKCDLEKVDQSVRGWNYGAAKFEGKVLNSGSIDFSAFLVHSFLGSTMRFEVEKENCFEVPLQNVSNCTTAKNEVTLEFHQNDECPVSLMEIRFHIPTSETSGDDPVEVCRCSDRYRDRSWDVSCRNFARTLWETRVSFKKLDALWRRWIRFYVRLQGTY